MAMADVRTARRVLPTCSCLKCGRSMQVQSFRTHERKNCPVLRFAEILRMPGERKATDALRQAVREQYNAKVVLPMSPEQAELLEAASHEAADRLFRWLRRQQQVPGKPEAPRGYQTEDRVKCPQCGAPLHSHYLQHHMRNACPGSREAREAQATERRRRQNHTCSLCGSRMTPGSRRNHIRMHCPVTRLSAFLERVGRKKATMEQRKEVRELYANRVALPMPPRFVEALGFTSYEVAEQIIRWLRRKQIRPTEEMKA